MSSLPRCRRAKRPTILAKRSQLAKKNLFNRRSYKPLYEKLKANNNALAKALSKEKQESQYLFSQNIALTSEVQELGVACNRRDDIISGVLKNAKETLQLLITMSTYVTNTIATCQQVVTTTRFTPRKSTANNRRDSTRRLSGKSPARGVVQPMVSGHTITKPTINLSRLNIQREYRVQNPPSLSDIDEVLTPEQSPSATESTTPVRVPIARSLNYGTRRVDRLPERLQSSMRASDENERRSSVRSNRNSSRHSGRRSHGTSERLSDVPVSRRSTQTASELQSAERLKSPRVALHDVSRLLQNSQSVNIRTLLESSNDMDLTQSQQVADSVMETSGENVAASKSEESIAETSEDPETEGNDYPPASEPSKSKPNSKKWITPSPSDGEDPLEGPSWLLNGTETALSSTEDEVTTTVNNSTPQTNAKDHAKSNQPAASEEEEGSCEAAEVLVASFVSLRGRHQRLADETNDEHTGNLTARWANDPSKFYRNFNNNDDDDDGMATGNIERFVTRKRGSVCDDDDDDYTLLWKRPGQPKNYNFDMNDLELPVLEGPIVAAVETHAPEPEPTTNIQRITQTFGSFTPACPRVNGEETIFNHTGLTLPVITENPDATRASAALVEQDEQSDEEELGLRKRKRQYKKKAIFDSPSDSDWVPTPKKKNSKLKRKTSKPKDPSSAKVVLQKLNETHVKKRSPSPESRPSHESDRQRRSSSISIQRDASSDSEGSSASLTVQSLSSRPRRQKAPKNLQEPSLGKKLRRN